MVDIWQFTLLTRLFSNLLHSFIMCLDTSCFEVNYFLIVQDEKPENQTISQFVRMVYTEVVDEDALLKQIGIDQLAPTQLACIKDLPLRSTLSCVIMFTDWINIGLYDFCTLPFSLKAHMSDMDKEFIEQNLISSWKGSIGDLHENIDELIEILKHTENDIASKVNEYPHVSYIPSLHKVKH